MDDSLAELVTLAQSTPARVQRLLADLAAQAGSEWFYVFWTRGAGGEGSSARRTRRLLAFATPDGAFTFAQRNNLLDSSSGPRLQRLSLARLLLVMLRKPDMGTLLLIRDDDLPLAAGHLPDSVVVARADLLTQLASDAAPE